MPVFKFSRITVGGSIQLPGISVYGENTEVPFFGTANITIPFSVYGESKTASGTGTIGVFSLGIEGADAGVLGNADIAFPLVSVFGSDGSALGELFSIPFYGLVSVDGEAVLNGLGSGDIYVKHFAVDGQQGASGNLHIPRIEVSGLCKQSVFTLGPSFITLPIMSVEGAGVHTETASGNIVLDFFVSGNGKTLPVTGGGGNIALMFRVSGRGGQGAAISFDEVDKILRHEDRRRLI